MKRRSILVLTLILVLAMAVMLTSCGAGSKNSANTITPSGNTETKEPAAKKTFEDYINANPSVKKDLEASGNANMTVSVKGNELIYTYDYSKDQSGVSKDTVMSDTVKDALKKAMAGSASSFGDLAKQLEKGSGIDGVGIRVEYTWEDTVIYSETFTSKDAKN